MRKYNSYHTILKQLAKKGTLPEKYLEMIDRTLIWRWKQETLNKFMGTELGKVEVLEQFLSRSESEKVMRIYLKIACMFSEMLNRSGRFHAILKQNLKDFVNILTRYGRQIDLNLVLKLCKISRSVFYYWKDLVFKECSTSPLKLCRKTYPNQLTIKETEAMKRLLTDNRFKYWPVCSLAWYALREKILSCSLSTWYLYNKRLGLIRCRIPKKKKYGTGIMASGPNEIWHSDITVVKTKDNVRHYVYLLMDNFSRYVLSWRVEACVSAKIRVETIREAYRKYTDGTKQVLLITDGGSENDNNEMKAFVDNEGVRINPVIALKDIPFSNSVIEAQNRLFKYRYLFRQDYENEDELKNVFAGDVTDYNDLRPHISLKGYTPLEAFKGINGLEAVWKCLIIEARQARITANRNELCEICE